MIVKPDDTLHRAIRDRMHMMPAMRAVRYQAIADQVRPPTESEWLRRRKVHLRPGYLATRYR